MLNRDFLIKFLVELWPSLHPTILNIAQIGYLWYSIIAHALNHTVNHFPILSYYILILQLFALHWYFHDGCFMLEFVNLFPQFGVLCDQFIYHLFYWAVNLATALVIVLFICFNFQIICLPVDRIIPLACLWRPTFEYFLLYLLFFLWTHSISNVF